MKNRFLVFVICCAITTAYSQFPKLNVNGLKDKALNAGKGAVNKGLNKKLHSSAQDKMNKAYGEYDPSSFKYAISFSDNAGLFEVHEKFNKHKEILNDVFQDHDVDFFSLQNTKRNFSSSPDEIKDAAKDEAKDETNVLTAEFHNQSGEIAYASGKFKLAEREFKNVFLITTSEADEQYRLAISNLGLLYQSWGRYNESLEWTEKALEIRKERNPNNAEYAVSLNNKGVLLKELGKYNEAEKYLEQSRTINMKDVGPTTLPVALNLNNLAVLFHETGRYEDAEKTMENALQIAKENLGEKSSNYIKLQINLAIIYMDLKKYENAEKVYLDAIKIKEKRLGSKHPDYAHLKKGLAALYLEMGLNDKVEPLLNEALSIYKEKLGEKHPSTAFVYYELGMLNRINNNLSKSEEYLTKSLSTRKELLGTNHPDYLKSLEEMALLNWQKKDIAKAKEQFNTILETTLSYIDTYFAPMSEKEKTKFWDKLKPRLYKFYSFTKANSKDKSLVNLMYKTHLKTKGMLLSSTNRIKQLILNGSDEGLKKKYLNWLDRKEELAKYYNYSKADLKEEEIDLAALEREVNAIEKELSSESKEFHGSYSTNEIGFNDIKNMLSSNEAVVDIIQFPLFNVKFNGEQAYTVISFKKESVTFDYTNLDEGKLLESRYSRYLNNCIRFNLNDTKSYDRYWAKIDEKIKGKTTVYVSRDGVFNQISLNAIKTPEGKYLLDKYKFIMVNNAKDIIAKKKRSNSKLQKYANLYGAPNYGGSKYIDELPGTSIEVAGIEKNLKVSGFKSKVYTGTSFTEAQLKSHGQNGILHIACHGFFFKDAHKGKEKLMGISTSKAENNPLLRSGLMVTGAENSFDTTKVDHSSSNNGIVTSYEIMNTDYSNIDLVVLSACETGLGDVKVGEGVYGLQRAFQVAGAKAIIMSLWKVDDTATQELMVLFYKNIAKGLNVETAFRNAELSLKEKYKKPKLWSAFVLINN